MGLWLVLGLVAVGAAVGWQVRAISVSPTPRLRAVETVAVALPFLLLIFGAVYSLMSRERESTRRADGDTPGSSSPAALDEHPRP